MTELFPEFVVDRTAHQSQLPPAANKFHVGNGEDGKHYWLHTTRSLCAARRRVSLRLRPVPVSAASWLRWPDVRVGSVELRQPALRIHYPPGEEEGSDRLGAKGDHRVQEGQDRGAGLSRGQVGADAAGSDRHRGPQSQGRALAGDRGRFHWQGHRAPHCLLYSQTGINLSGVLRWQFLKKSMRR